MRYGLIVDLRSIQDYIFSSNQLKDNIGSSYLVKHLFDDIDKSDGFCGGGNLFRLCNDEDEAKEIIRNLSIKVYEKCPGLSFSACYIPNFDPNDYQSSMNRLQEKLQIEKNIRLQQTTLPSYGINAQCSSSVYAAEFVSKTGLDAGSLFSRVIYTKRQASSLAVSEAQKHYREALGDTFVLPESFEDLGQDKGNESFIAVVHIDGNQIGELFRKQESFSETKTLSKRIDDACDTAFKGMLAMAVEQITKGQWTHYLKRLKKAGDKYYLPIRPIFIGGDDITFISEGRLGLSLAQDFMNRFKEQLGDLDVSSCAGIALAKTNYPFYQIHKLAGMLCRSAKNKRKEHRSKLDFLDFHIISSSVSQDLAEIRKTYYRLGDGRTLCKRPFSSTDMDYMVQNAGLLNKWPKSKIKELRSVLYQSSDQCAAFDAQRKSRADLKLPATGFDPFAETMFLNNETIFLDMIELIEMLPLEDSK